MKQRITSLDLQILGKELKLELEGCRLNNIYSIADSNRQFLLKFNKSESKVNVVIDCGLKIHITDFTRPIPPSPSQFVIKLRKHLKSKRLTTVKQIDNDRILVLSFANGLYFLVLEFFAAGNVLLLDENRKIMALHRVVQDHQTAIGITYTMFDETFLQNTEQKLPTQASHSLDEIEQLIEDKKLFYANTMTKQSQVGSKGKQKIPSIQNVIFSAFPHLSNELILKCCKSSGLDPSTSLLEFEGNINSIVCALNKTEEEFCSTLKNSIKIGYILAKRNALFDEAKDKEDTEYTYEQFYPFVPYIAEDKLKDVKVIEIEGNYNRTVDTYFSTIESTKYALRIQNQEDQAKKKLEKAKIENNKKIQQLVDMQQSNEKKGYAIIANADIVEEAKLSVQGLVDQQMDWVAMEKLIKNEQLRGNKVAQLIQLPLKLKENKIQLLLPIPNDETDKPPGEDKSDSDNDEWSDDSSSTPEDEYFDKNTSKPTDNSKSSLETVSVMIDLSLSAYANASNYYEIKKHSAKKQAGVEQNVQRAMKNIEHKIETNLKKKLKEQHEVLRVLRKRYFFENYTWFISNEGFLALMGKSGIETDQIFSKYIQKDDVCVSNAFGSKVWIKNPYFTEIPPNTLMQAGVLANSASEAWSKKVASSPWWCSAKNLSKFDDIDGSLLGPGEFRVVHEERKTFLPPAQLVMGMALLWKVKTDDSDDKYEETGEAEEEIDGTEDMLETIADVNQSSWDNETNETPGEAQHSLEGAEEETTGTSELYMFSDDHIETEETNLNKAAAEADPTHSVTSILEAMSNKKVRGKKGKLKKMQKRYADQDEEEMIMRLQALGTLKGIEKQRQQKEEDATKQKERESKKMRRERQKQQQALKFTSSEFVKINYDKIFKELKPTPLEDDEILAVLPVFAPWSSVGKYKYKVKIQPGSMKKTKTINEVLHHFLTRTTDSKKQEIDKSSAAEIDLIKQLKVQEFIPLICVDRLKVTIPGSSDTKSSKGSSKGKTKKTK
ncbi:HGL017Wp [Eremothecium sinecaudum]|uniref:Ribosome quality control complex subunit 2 n=1 Tax=Eremothecium sinecaudum TaxID=45286 RepID=A0A109V0R5_9SACH|nr:HGL017Wp [Eremothecium sinecaudum]AMD22323.1 HGL017Wp [Eremothecium sinecaudum]